MSRQDNRSDAALRERLELAEKAVPKGEKTIWTADFASPHETCVRDAFTERILTMEDYTDQATAAHIAANHPDVVRADIEEILRLRQEVARLELENQRLTVAGANDEAYLLTCLDIIRKAVGMPVGSDWQQVAERVERLDKEADWLVKIMFFYTEECPLKMKIQDELPIPKLDGCDGTWPDDDYFDCTNSTPEKCWREAARKAVEDENG